MSLVDATLFIERIIVDEEFALQLAELQDEPTEVVFAVRGAGYDVTIDEVREVFLERFGDALDEQQLAAIAGGQIPEVLWPDDFRFGDITIPDTTGTAAAAAA